MSNKVPTNLQLINEEHNYICCQIVKHSMYNVGIIGKSICNKKASYSNGIRHYCKHHSLKQRWKIQTINVLVLHGQKCYNTLNSKLLYTFDTKQEALEVYNTLNDNILLCHKSKSHINITNIKYKNDIYT